MTYYFIYTDLGYGSRPQDKFDLELLLTVNSKLKQTDTKIHAIGEVLNNDELKRCGVVAIEDQTNAVMFKMTQDQFIKTRDRYRPKLSYVLAIDDWRPIDALSKEVQEVLDNQVDRKDMQLQVTRMVRNFNKFYDIAAMVESLDGDFAAKLADYDSYMNESVNKWRATNKAEAAKLTRERAKLKKKLLSYSFK